MSEHLFVPPLTDDELSRMLRLRRVVDRVDPMPELAVDPAALAARSALVRGNGRGTADSPVPLVRPPGAGIPPAGARGDVHGADAHPGAGPTQTARAAMEARPGPTEPGTVAAPPVAAAVPAGRPRTPAEGAVPTAATRLPAGHQTAVALEPEGALRAPTTAAPAGGEGGWPTRGLHLPSPPAPRRDAAVFFVALVLLAAAALLARRWGLW